ncbi:SUR7/PalI family [Aspergillus sclerotialis]|uniref:SUR7/PalI family n=1 Tax=Aspergillus sclerotialis TaxID=2070753 RepID=A0A3A3A8X8_9EURO|nr:SUR7/PalI family [Aspergillus sclerotialis]
MSYCEGVLGQSSERKVKGCFNQTLPFSFDPTEAMLRHSPQGTSLRKRSWPTAITGDFKAFTLTTQTMSVLYCIGTAVAAIAIVVKVGFALARAPNDLAVEASFLLLSSTSLGIASIIATVLSFEFVSLINYHGEASRVSAKYGHQFLGMTWAAVALVLFSSITSGVFAIVGRGQSGPRFSLEEAKAPGEGEPE